jgi:hypothetical protein
MVKVKTTRGFLSPVLGEVDKDQVITVSRSMAQQMIEVGAAVMVETYETKVVVDVPLVPPSQSLPAAPVLPEEMPKKRGRKAKSL